MHLLPPPIAHLDEYRERRNARLAQGIDPTPLDVSRFDLNAIAREWAMAERMQDELPPAA